jgi:AraC-like DNA-binding protein
VELSRHDDESCICPCPLTTRAAIWTIVTTLTVRLTYGRPAEAHYPPGATFGPRTLDDFELVWMLAGCARWRRHDVAQELTLRPGQLLLARPGMRHEFRWDKERPTTHGYVHFATVEPVSHDNWPLLQRIAAPGPFEGWLSYLVWLAETAGTQWQSRAEDVLATLVRTFVDGPLPDSSERPEPAVITAALEYVRHEWRRGVRCVTVGELAAAAQVSPAHLSRLFRREFGCGPATGLELVRLARARSLLTRSNLTITQVARAAGFTDPLYFSRRFRAVHGRSPSTYRTDGGGTQSYPPALHGLTRRLYWDG